MRLNLPVTGREYAVPPDAILVSATDLKSRITHCNRAFVEVSGYTPEELLGQPHNMIRHPDMPRGVFKLLWDTIATQREIFAYVKNMSKDGSFYWVFANVTPSLDLQGQLEGYFSVRRKPKSQAVGVMADIYRQMLEVEHQAGPRDASDASIAWLSSVLQKQGVSYESFILSI